MVQPDDIAMPTRNAGMDDQEFLRKSVELGLDKAAAEHAADLRKALENGLALSEKIPDDLDWTQEPSHTFSLIPTKRTT